MSQIDTLHKLIETMTDQNHGEPITREALREACALLNLFPEHRFRKAFHQALVRLVKTGVILHEPDDRIALVETLAEIRQDNEIIQKQRATSDRDEKPKATEADIEALYNYLVAHGTSGEPVDPYSFRDYMNVGVISCALRELRVQGRVRLYATVYPTNDMRVVLTPPE